AGLYALRVETVHVDVAAVADDQALIGIEEAQPLRHIIQRGFKAQILRRNYLVAIRELPSGLGERMKRLRSLDREPRRGCHHGAPYGALTKRYRFARARFGAADR